MTPENNMRTYFLFLAVLLCLTSSFSRADDKDNAISSTINNLTSSIESGLNNIIGGEGDSEVSISTSGEDSKPTFSIMSVKPLSPHADDSALFVQIQLSNLKVSGEDRLAGNLGLGKRNLSEDKNTIQGLNVFLDFDEEGNARASIGLEFRRSAFEALANVYAGLSGATSVGTATERVLDGTEISLVGEIPYLPWANIIYKNYKWEAEKNSKNSEGEKLSAELTITPSIIIEAGHDDNNINGSNTFAKFLMVFPARERVSASTNLIGDTMFTSGDMSGELLSKVRRTNTMIIETEGTGVVIARATE